MTISPLLFYVLVALGLVLLLWVGAATLLVIAMRRQLRHVTAERDNYARQVENLFSIVGQPATITNGPQIGQSGPILWVYSDEVCVQTETGEVTVKRVDIEIEAT